MREGILDLIENDRLHEESAFETNVRDEQATAAEARLSKGAREEWEAARELLEIRPTIEALELEPEHVVVELGCGTGAFTMFVVDRCRSLLAVDLSIGSLTVLGRRLSGDACVGLVRADVGRLALAPDSVDRLLSTLVSNLPTARHVAAMMRASARALSSDGKFVFGTHHYSWRSRLQGEPKSGSYPENGVYRYLYSRREIVRRASRYFGSVRARPIVVQIPGARRLGLPTTRLAQLAERTPLGTLFGELLLVTAGRPRPLPTTRPRATLASHP